MKFHETENWIFGDVIQRKWASLIAKRGGMVMPAYAMQGVIEDTGAPMLLTSEGPIVMPDILLLDPERPPVWQDVKAKTAPDWYRNKGRGYWEHGCDWATYQEYKRVEQITGNRVFLVVYEKRSPEDPSTFSKLVANDSDVWLTISLNSAYTIGRHSPLWPNPATRGRKKMGGLLWPRDEMALFL